MGVKIGRCGYAERGRHMLMKAFNLDVKAYWEKGEDLGFMLRV